jgi:hypothetical protein
MLEAHCWRGGPCRPARETVAFFLAPLIVGRLGVVMALEHVDHRRENLLGRKQRSRGERRGELLIRPLLELPTDESHPAPFARRSMEAFANGLVSFSRSGDPPANS